MEHVGFLRLLQGNLHPGVARRDGGAIADAGVVLALAMALVLVMFPAIAFASSPEVIGSAPSDGAAGVPCDGRLWVQFENNVANVEGNAALVTLERADGAEVPHERYAVSLPDAQIEFEYRQYVWMDVNGLDPGVEYAIVVAPGVQAKNGKVNEDGARIGFTTAAVGEASTELAAPTAVERGSGNGDGTGGGKTEEGSNDAPASDGDQSGESSGSASNSDGGQVGESAGSASGSEEANGDSASASDSDGSAEAGASPEGEDPENQDAQSPERLPAGEIALIAICVLAVLVALAFAVRRSLANVR